MTFTLEQIAEGNVKLLKLADALEHRADLASKINLEPYDQRQYMYECGSPGCAAGLWAFMNPETWTLIQCMPVMTELFRSLNSVLVRSLNSVLDFNRLKNLTIESLRKEFSTDEQETSDLFSNEGCGTARNELEAARYIRNFVAEREAYLKVMEIYSAPDLFTKDEENVSETR